MCCSGVDPKPDMSYRPDTQLSLLRAKVLLNVCQREAVISPTVPAGVLVHSNILTRRLNLESVNVKDPELTVLVQPQQTVSVCVCVW